MIPAAVEIAKKYEGLHKQVTKRPVILVVPYLCPASYWTIGYGHLCDKNHPAITAEEAEEYLIKDLNSAWVQAVRLCPNLVCHSEERQAAIIDFVFNLGAGRLKSSTLRKRILAEDWGEVQRELRRWVFGSGRKLPGLVLRREEECALINRA